MNRLTGFSMRNSQRQRSTEDRLSGLVSSDRFREHLVNITSEPHVAGSAANARVADYLAKTMSQAGLSVARYPYDVYLPSGETEIQVSLVTPLRQPLNNQEDILEDDPYSQHPDLGPGWNAYTGSGDVTGEIVYANYGTREDFALLRDLGISIKGKLVLARFGGNFRGYKAKYAEEAGAIGLIIYSDPADGGYQVGAGYPEDRYMNDSTVQRGSLLTLNYPGDPLTPGEPALPLDSETQIERLDPQDVGLPQIPVAPLPWRSADEILRRMSGQAVPQGWQGGLPYTYRLTGGPALTVRLRVSQPLDTCRAENVIGTLPGSEIPDEWIILGCHYDAWGYGTSDPNSGTAMLLCLAEALGTLAQEGLTPRRSILIAHWDAEEQGIIGSTEWIEQFGAELAIKAVAYINADMAATGPHFGASAAPSLKRLIVEATQAVAYPKSEGNVYDTWAPSKPEGLPPMGNLGGGSDHVGFYTRIGVPCCALGLGNACPVYHSIYDNLTWYERFGDGEYIYGPTLVKLDGVLALRLANADILPYDIASYATDLQTHVSDLQKLAQERKVEGDWKALETAIATLDASTTACIRTRDDLNLDALCHPKHLPTVNAALVGLEKAFIDDGGLQERPWFRSLYASTDPYSGYAAWMLPGLRFEIENNDATSLARWQEKYVAAVNDLTERIRMVTQLLNEM